MIKKISAGTQFYLMKKNSKPLCIQPDKTLINDNLYVKYDVKVDGQIIIPRGTRVVGDWVTESRPTIAAQLQLTQIYLQADGQKIMADSDLYESLTDYNFKEINDADYIYKQKQHQSTSNITRRIVNFDSKTKTLFDNQRNVIYIEIPTSEIIVTLMEDFIAMPCLDIN